MTIPRSAPLCFVRNAFSGTVLCYATASLTLGGSSAARPLLYCLTLACCAWFGLRRRTPAPSRRYPYILEIISFNIALTLFLGELSLRAWAACSGRSLIVSDALDAYRLVPGRRYSGGLRGNQLGFPGPDFTADKSPGIIRIAALGDSFAVAPTVPFSDNYLTRLESEMPLTEVFNFGISGTGPREYALVLGRYVWTYQPDLVLVSIFVGNDITEIMATPRRMDPRQLSLYLLASRSARLLLEQMRRHEEGMKNVGSRMKNPDGTGLSLQTFREIEARRLSVCLKAPPPNLEKKWRQAESYLKRIIADCGNHDVPVAFVLIPDEFQVTRTVFADALEGSAWDIESLDIGYPQRRLSAFLEERGIAYLDLMPAFAPVQDTYTPHDTHWNIRGNHLAAKCIGEWLKSLKR